MIVLGKIQQIVIWLFYIEVSTVVAPFIYTN